MLPVQVLRKPFTAPYTKIFPFFLCLPAFLHSFIWSLLPFVPVSQLSSTLWALWLRALCWKTKHIEDFHEPPLKQAIFYIHGNNFHSVSLEWIGPQTKACASVFMCGRNSSPQRAYNSDWIWGNNDGQLLAQCTAAEKKKRTEENKLHRGEHLAFEAILHYCQDIWNAAGFTSIPVSLYIVSMGVKWQ